MMITILLVDDQPSVRQGLRMRLTLEPDVIVVGEAGNGATALDLAMTLRPDVVVMDVEMPDMDGMVAAAQLRTIAPQSAVVIVSMHDDAATRRRALDAGVASVIGKYEAAEMLPDAIRQAAAH
jgi:DNA-binding NarL/FixJ family response regulator